MSILDFCEFVTSVVVVTDVVTETFIAIVPFLVVSMAPVAWLPLSPWLLVQRRFSVSPNWLFLKINQSSLL